MIRQQTRFTDDEITSCQNQLPRDHVEILRAAQTGANYQDMSEGLRLPKGTMKSRLSRARTALIAALARKAESP